jgi:hypothetical protein
VLEVEGADLTLEFPDRPVALDGFDLVEGAFERRFKFRQQIEVGERAMFILGP